MFKNWKNWLPMLVQTGGAMLFGLIGLSTILLGAGLFSIPMGIIGAMGWFGYYFAIGFQRISPNKYIVWERLGKFVEVSREGPMIACLPGLIDCPAANGGSGDFEYHDIPIADEKNKIDFIGGGTGTPVGEINYRVINQKEIPVSTPRSAQSDQTTTRQEARDGAWLFTYTVGDTANLILRIILGALRQKLQKHTVEEAGVSLDLISQQIRIDPNIRSALREMGVELHPENGVVLTDLQLDEKVIAARQEVETAAMKVLVAEKKVLEAEHLAQGQVKFGQGFIDTVRIIYEEGKKLDRRYTTERATELLLSMRGLEVLQTHSGSDLTLVGRGLQDVVTSIRVGNHGNTDDNSVVSGPVPESAPPTTSTATTSARKKKGGA